jgi:pimeloyl-ACP methyl ester carboxylesterase
MPLTTSLTTHTRTIHNTSVHYAERGEGMVVLALHGGYVDHQEIAACLEPFFETHAGYRRIYPDLPGMGRTPASENIKGSDDIVALLSGFIDEVVGTQPFVMIAHSYGTYLARAIANQRREQVQGIALICPVMAMGQDTARQVPEPVVLHNSVDTTGVLDPDDDAEYRNYFVIQTPETLKRFQTAVMPGVALADTEALARIFEGWQLRDAPEQGDPYPHPTLVVMGRQDSTVGYADQWQLLNHYSRATFAVLDGTGHALPHEQPALLSALLEEWLFRVENHRSTE